MDLFGTKNDDALDAQQDWNEHLFRYLQWRTKMGRNDVAKWMPKARETGKAGYRSAFTTQRQTIPEQLKAMRHANVAAQGTLLGGLDQMNNAILGNPVDMSGLQVYDPGNRAEAHFKQQQVPHFLKSTGQKQAMQEPGPMASYLGGGGELTPEQMDQFVAAMYEQGVL